MKRKKTMKKLGLSWKVWFYDSNSHEIVVRDILKEGGGLYADIESYYKKVKTIPTMEAFRDKVRGDLFYYYCSRAEYELIFQPWIGSRDVTKEERKVDIYQQVMINADRFFEYLYDKLFGGLADD